MLAQSNAKQDQPASLEAGYRPRARWRVVEVKVLPAYRLNVRFDDGLEGIVDMDALVHSPGAGVFAALSEPKLFAMAGIQHGVVTWPTTPRNSRYVRAEVRRAVPTATTPDTMVALTNPIFLGRLDH